MALEERMFIDSTNVDNIRIAIVDSNGALKDLLIENTQKKSVRNNIYYGTIVRVEHSLQACFVDYGCEKNGFLPFSEIHPDYYQLPAAEIEKIKQGMQKTRNAIGENSEDENIGNGLDEELDIDGNVIEPSREVRVKYSIQDVIKKGQNVLVQVFKDERGNKGVSLTTYISLAGRYCVFMPNSSSGIGISKKISDEEERVRIMKIAESFCIIKETSLVIRTAGDKVEETELKRDYEYLIALWNKLRQKTLSSKVLSLIYEDGGVIRQTMRDNYHHDIASIIVEGDSGFQDVIACISDFAPQDKKKIVQYKGKTPVFYKYNIEAQIDSLLKERVDLASGGYVIINQTEALVAIDVNSGKATTERSVEDTALLINKEAAYEIARQVRLRDLGGLIIIDFIDMISLKNRKIIEQEIRNAFSNDKARVQFARISMFGLLELSRQRTRASLWEVSAVVCQVCHGSGIVKSADFVIDSIVRALESMIPLLTCDALEVKCSRDVACAVRSIKKNPIAELSAKIKLPISVVDDLSLDIDRFILSEINKKTGTNKIVLDNIVNIELPQPVECNRKYGKHGIGEKLEESASISSRAPIRRDRSSSRGDRSSMDTRRESKPYHHGERFVKSIGGGASRDTSREGGKSPYNSRRRDDKTKRSSRYEGRGYDPDFRRNKIEKKGIFSKIVSFFSGK